MSGIPDQLRQLLPSGSQGKAASWLDVPGLGLKLYRRKSHRLGAYVYNRQGGDWIMLNTVQHPYSLLITLAHEVAHMRVTRRHGRKARPHGAEWQEAFRELILEATTIPELPQDMLKALLLIARKPRSTHFSDPAISAILMLYETPGGTHAILDNLPAGSRFSLPNGKIYIKGEKNRTRYRCTLSGTNRVFLVGGAVPVRLVA
jgi:SprT protein